MSTRPPRIGTIYQQFVVVGYPSGAPVNPNPMAENESAEILFYYPEDTPPVEGVLPLILTVVSLFLKENLSRYLIRSRSSVFRWALNPQ